MTDAVTIGIPAWNASAFLRETVESALVQTWPNTRIVISVDQSDDDTATIAEDYARRLDRVHVVIQPQRLGWVGNTNAVLSLTGTRYGMILPHDDIPHPTYVERCLATLKARPEAVVSVADVEAFGSIVATDRQLEFVGPLVDRVERMVRDGMNVPAYHGLIDMQRLGGRFVPEVAKGMFGDTLWLGRLAVAGDVVRIPEFLYRKRMYERSTQNIWRAPMARAEDRLWLAHTADLEAVIYADAPALRREPRIREAFVARALRQGRAFYRTPTPIAGATARMPMLRARFERFRRDLTGW
jgi:glycosyltransferase involved in cell wall biosynthesis